ncbi:MAG: RluA family pseudouridine synthase [Planctomycetota bacterium]
MAKPAVEIIYEDGDIIVINKPSGISVTADRSGKLGLADILEQELGPQAASQVRLVHRLDKDTSGVMILALNAQAQATFTRYFEKGLVRKTYLALVTGVVPEKQGAIDAPLARNLKKARLMCVERRRGKDAVTHWRLLADFGPVSLLAVSPLTGRTHQIRVHLAGIGLPLAIDPLYGSSQPLYLSDFKADYRLGKGQTEKPLIDRLTLHAYQLSLPAEPPFSLSQQSTGSQSKNLIDNSPHRPDCFVARLDKKFAAALKMLTKYNPKGLSSFVNTNDFSTIIDTDRLQ